MANILGLAELIREDIYRPEEKEEFMDGLFTNVERLNTVISDLNHILQVKRGIGEKKEKIRLSQLVEDIRSSIKNLVEKEGVQILTDFEAEDEFVSLKSYLHSIFYNLISNSIKYRRTDVAPIIKIESRIAQDSLILTFEDNGLGIDLDKQGEQVFGLYKRFHPKFEGKGMGLFMVKTQVEILGGKISIKSAPNEGTIFIIEFKNYKQ